MHPFWRSLLDFFYPPRCQICYKFSPEPFCAQCRDKITLINPPVCARCGAPLDPLAKGPDLCSDCLPLSRFPITWARAAGIYQGPLQRAIVGMKFAGRRSLAVPLADLLVESMKNGLYSGHAAFDFACPVPLHPQRLQERGFNQSELIARYFCEKIGLYLDTTPLERTRPTLPQVLLPPEQRLKNVRGAFDLSPDADVQGKQVLLIDDLYTTGSTLKECARVLRRGGAAEVYVLTLARPRPPWMTPDRREE